MLQRAGGFTTKPLSVVEREHVEESEILNRSLKENMTKMHVKNMMAVGKQGEQWLPFKYEAAKILY